MGALRRPQHLEDKGVDPQRAAQVEPYVGRRYPRWMVVSGLVFYCAVFWALVVAAGTWGVELVRAASAGAQ
jgi:hypothetical protein